MNDLISRSALIAEFDEYIERNRSQGTYGNNWCADTCEVLRDTIVKVAPTVDAVPVVRCGDCKWYKKSKRYGHYQCGNPNEGMLSRVELMPYDYCSYGERRNGDG